MENDFFNVVLADVMGGLPPFVGWVLLAWLFVLGGTVGSFLNVVVYRVPAGMSLIRPGSHCPACEQAIRWYDNVPIFGWIWLRGRCRDCGAKISPHYPIVEALTAAMFVALAWVEIFCDGANLPRQSIAADGGVVFPGLPVQQFAVPQLMGIYVYHLLLLCTLLAAALIDLDGKRVPLNLAVPAAVAGLLAPIIWPVLHPVPAFLGLEGQPAALVGVAAGLGVGLLLGLLLCLIVPEKQRLGAVSVAACMGLFLGWQAAVMLCVPLIVVLLFEAALRQLWPGVRFFPATAWLAAGTFAWILAWRPLVELTGP